MKISDRVTSFLKENFISPTSHLLCEKSREKSEKSFLTHPHLTATSIKEGGGGGPNMNSFVNYLYSWFWIHNGFELSPFNFFLINLNFY